MCWYYYPSLEMRKHKAIYKITKWQNQDFYMGYLALGHIFPFNPSLYSLPLDKNSREQ